MEGQHVVIYMCPAVAGHGGESVVPLQRDRGEKDKAEVMIAK